MRSGALSSSRTSALGGVSTTISVVAAGLQQLVQLLHRHVLGRAAELAGELLVEAIGEDALGHRRARRDARDQAVEGALGVERQRVERRGAGARAAPARGSLASSSRPSASFSRRDGSTVITAVARPRRAAARASAAAVVVLPTPPAPTQTIRRCCEQRVERRRGRRASPPQRLAASAAAPAAMAPERRSRRCRRRHAPASGDRRAPEGARAAAPRWRSASRRAAIARRAAASSGSSPRGARGRRSPSASAAVKRRGQTRLRTGRRERTPTGASAAARLERLAHRHLVGDRHQHARACGARSSSSACRRPTRAGDRAAPAPARASWRGVRSSRRAWPLAGPSTIDRRRTARARRSARARSTAARCSRTTNSVTPGAAAVTAWKVALANSRRDRNGRRSRRRK